MSTQVTWLTRRALSNLLLQLSHGWLAVVHLSRADEWWHLPIRWGTSALNIRSRMWPHPLAFFCLRHGRRSRRPRARHAAAAWHTGDGQTKTSERARGPIFDILTWQPQQKQQPRDRCCCCYRSKSRRQQCSQVGGARGRHIWTHEQTSLLSPGVDQSVTLSTEENIDCISLGGRESWAWRVRAVANLRPAEWGWVKV